MYTPKDLKNEGQHIFFKLLSFVIYTNLLYVVLLFLNRDICQPEGFDAYGYPSELFKLDMERLGIAAKRKPAKIIDFTKYIDTNRSTNH